MGINYTDVVLSFAVLVSFTAVAPWFYELLDLGASEVDPLSNVLLQILMPLVLIVLLLSMGVSART